ncbi:MAG: hypothetical protein BRC40_09380 [Cyanobacteria bacterium QH_8_48_120]|nr:MAG: hypothetical protein BRC34_10035 [Cyanobacteria bacterium QH_1_48_107]PSO53303.1 MAG: hypothetical protein BRC35_16315 [Cyanobacteria bacterium QH_10_48_56]PSO59126.1 MAG: hypothetical protein BRC39_11730 [Cyanobacteria bacterium QH_7_48_89]PSO70912.1 MAG: hypothetical protein BRC42_08780 [Cyanobacteria bacterium QS_1_48_34]PSO72846.1 MAG: hypothetical protein BRC40_09380 [Cyanobacteria bacterium QH_8_48_120]PSO75781.1 MAG: hypothetical protein BRC37_04635 [Cyanobacteria bacterium QH_3
MLKKVQSNFSELLAMKPLGIGKKMPLSFTDNKDFNPFPFVSFENFDVCFSAIGVELNTLIFVETRELKNCLRQKGKSRVCRSCL